MKEQVLGKIEKGDKKILKYNKDKLPKLIKSVGLRPKKSSGLGWFLGLSCSCGWFGSFDSVKSKPYNDEYFAYCPKCGKPEPEEALLRIIAVNNWCLD